MIRYADIALNIPLAEPSLTYQIPESMKSLDIGMRVEVDLRNRKEEGVVLSIHSLMPNYPLKTILKQVDKLPILTQEQIQLGHWMSEFYLASLGESLYKMIPSGRRLKKKLQLDVNVEASLLKLNEEQSIAYKNIRMDFGKESTHLLFGITGSGKTEVYIHLLNDLMRQTDKSAILLVPEISLTVQTLKRLVLIFGSKLAILHSALKTSFKFSEYNKILTGEKRIVVGTRSAIFAPVKNLGLIIIDEEHDPAYKEHSNPRYLTRHIAMQRCKTNQAVLVLGSATPSLEVYFQAIKNNIGFQELTKKAKTQELSKVTLYEKKNNSDIIGDELLFQIKKRLERNEQVILLLNRRGHSPMIYSREDKKFIECPNCTSNLCYHKSNKAICHLCGYAEGFVKLEKRINKKLELLGAGTQKLEEHLLEKFPKARIERLDQDVSKNKETLTNVIQRLLNQEIDILTGTQMIAKGLDASHVTLVGVLNANNGLGIPDFRANERVYSLLTQVAGRAGRAELKGEVLIETTNKNHPVIQMSTEQNYKNFFEVEVLIRHAMFYPPFSRIIRLVTRSKSEPKSLESIELIMDILKKNVIDITDGKTQILGPSACFFYKMDSNFRNHIIIKTSVLSKIRELIQKKVQICKLPSTVYLEIDIDPVDLL